jgi:hypothetical protein
MLAKDALVEFRRLLTTRRVDLSGVSPRQAVEAMLAFFREAEASDCDTDADGDMLLFQWGTYDWGRGRYFEFDITRQLIPRGRDDDDIWQLSFTLKFPPTSDLAALGASDRWCHSRDELDAFTAFVTGSPAFRAVADVPGQAELDYECAG